MGAPSKPRVVSYDASEQQAKASMQGLDLLNKAQGQAYTSSRVSSLLGQEALNRTRIGVSLLGEYLKDRNLSMSNQVPIDADYYQQTSDIGSKYASKASSLFGGK
jgi:hypothetical protein